MIKSKLKIQLAIVAVITTVASGCGGGTKPNLSCAPCGGAPAASTGTTDPSAGSSSSSSSGTSSSDSSSSPICSYNACMNYMFSATKLATGQPVPDQSTEVDDPTSLPSSESAEGQKVAIVSNLFYNGTSFTTPDLNDLGAFDALWDSHYFFADKGGSCRSGGKDSNAEWSNKCKYGTFSDIFISQVVLKTYTAADFLKNLQKVIGDSGIADSKASGDGDFEGKGVSVLGNTQIPIWYTDGTRTGSDSASFINGHPISNSDYNKMAIAMQNLTVIPIEKAQDLCKSLTDKSPVTLALKKYSEKLADDAAKASVINPDLAAGGNACPSNPPPGGGYNGGGGAGLQGPLGQLADVRAVMGDKDLAAKKTTPDQQKSDNAASDGGTLNARAPSSVGDGIGAPSSGSAGGGDVKFANPSTTAAGGPGSDSGKLSLNSSAPVDSGGTADKPVNTEKSAFDSAASGGGGGAKSGFANPFGGGGDGVVGGSATSAQFGNLGPNGNVYTGDIEEYLAKNGKVSLFKIVNLRMDKWGGVIQGEAKSLEMKKLTH